MDKNTNKLQLNFVLPSLFTAASAFLGVISIFATVKGEHEKAVMYIMLSLVFDALDGRIARMTNTTSKFGAEFDSLADIVAFGVAPSVLFYYSVGSNFGKLGSLIAAMYVVFGAIRLARFNITNTKNKPSVFIGIPIPAAAVLMAMWILVYEKYPFLKGLELFIVFIQALVAILMVSNIRYPSFKKIDLHKSNVIKILVYMTMIFSLVYLYPIEALTALFTLYLLYGLARAFYTLFVAKFKKNKYNSQTDTKEMQ